MKSKKLCALAVMSMFALPFAVNAKDISSDFTLTENVKDGIVVKSGSNVVLDLAGYDITNENDGDTIKVENGASLTIKGNGNVTNNNNNKAVILNYGTLVVKGGTYSRVEEKDHCYYVLLSNGSATLDGGTFKIVSKVENSSSLIRNGGDLNEDGSKPTMVINGGNYEMVTDNKYIKNDDYGIMTVNGGTFTTDSYATAVLGNIGKETVLTVNGGTFNHGGKYQPIWVYDGEAVINGGIYNLISDDIEINDGGTLNVDFGKYSVIGSDTSISVKESDLTTKVEVNDVKKEDITEEEVSLIDNAVSGKYKLVGYYNIDLFKTLLSNTDIKLEEIAETSSKVKVTLEIPSTLESVSDGYKRVYYVVRVHDGKTDILDTTINEDGTLSFETDKFSTYSLVYEDIKVEKEANPKTFDGSIAYLVISIISLLGVAYTSCKFVMRDQHN